MEYKFLKYLEQIEQISNIEYIESTTVFVETYKFTYNSSNYRVCFSIYFPFDLPEFFAEQKMKKLHVDQRGKVCYDDVEDLLFDYNDHLDVIKKAFNSFFTIIDYDAHENEYSYEFNDYQRYYKRFDMNRNSYIFGDFRFNTPHLVNKYTHGNQEVFIDIDDKNRDYITHNIENNTLKNVLYIPFKNIPIIPNVNDELFFSDFNDCYDKVDLNKIHKLLKNITEIIYSIKNPNGFYNCVNVKFEGKIKSLNQKIQATSINSINIYDFDFLKERSGSKTRNERILMIGLGSLGSETLYHLCKTGFINIDLCDFDAFYPSNIYRHFLGFNSVFDSFKKELTFGSKVEKLKNEMKNRYPDLNSNIYVKGIHKLLLDNTIDISQYDYIISTTGNTVVNLFLNDYLYKNKISTKLLIAWLEPYGVGRHILRVNTAIRGCLQCLILSKNNVHIADENGNYKIRNDNCTGSFSRFGNLDVSKLAVEIVEELLNDNFSMNKHIVRKGSFTDFLQDYHKLTDFSEMSDETIDLKGEDFIYAGCNVCGRHNH